ncbi:MAG: hypothetical protein IKP14_04665 [Clostridiales bacterium]|nr:hypothetical protein [Clostridiales bacterium]
MGVSDIRCISFKLMSEIDWNKMPAKKTADMTNKVQAAARKMASVDYSKPARTKLPVKAKFYMVRMLQTNLGKQDPEYTDFKYWKANGWLDSKSPWRA